MARSATEIQLDLTAAYAARRASLSGGEEYSIDSGQGRQSVKRPLASINATIRELEAELLEAESGGGPVLITMDRGVS